MVKGSQRDPNRHPVLCWTDVSLMAKVYTAIEGRKVDSKGLGRRGKSTSKRAMGASDLFIEAVEEKLRDVVPSPRALAKCKKLLERNRKRNESSAWESATPEEKERCQNKKMLIYYRSKVAKDRRKLSDAKRRGADAAVLKTLEGRLASAEAGFAKYEAACSGYDDLRRRKR